MTVSHLTQDGCVPVWCGVIQPTAVAKESTIAMEIMENTAVPMLDEVEELKDFLGDIPRSAFDTSSKDPRLAFVCEDDDDSGNDDEENEDDDENDSDDDSDSDSDDDKDKPDKDKVTVSKAEAEELKRLRAEDRKRKRQEEKDKRKRKQQEGKLQELVEEKEEENQELAKDRDEWKSKYENLVAEQKVTRVARKLNMNDPEDAMLYLDAETKAADEQVIESQLKKLRKRKGHLFSDRPPTGGGHGGGSNGGSNGKLLTFEEMQKMSTSEIQENQELVDKSMAALSNN